MNAVGMLRFACALHSELYEFGEPGRTFLGRRGAQAGVEYARLVEAEQRDRAVGQFSLAEAAKVTLELVDRGQRIEMLGINNKI